MFPEALNTSCDSSTTFQTRSVRSLPPALTALSRDKLSMAVRPSSCPNLHGHSQEHYYYEANKTIISDD